MVLKKLPDSSGDIPRAVLGTHYIPSFSMADFVDLRHSSRTTGYEMSGNIRLCQMREYLKCSSLDGLGASVPRKIRTRRVVMYTSREDTDTKAVVPQTVFFVCNNPIRMR